MKMNKIALAGLATAALVFAPSAAADVPGLAPSERPRIRRKSVAKFSQVSAAPYR
jgi:hypothetical protein